MRLPRFRPRPAADVTGSVAVVAALTAGVVAAISALAVAVRSVSYPVTSQWPGAGNTDVNANNTGDPINGGTASGFNDTWNGSNPASASFAINAIMPSGPGREAVISTSGSGIVVYHHDVDNGASFRDLNRMGSGSAGWPYAHRTPPLNLPRNGTPPMEGGPRRR